MRIGDRVFLSVRAIVVDSVREKFKEPGIISHIYTEWEDGDIICWDVRVSHWIDGREFVSGFYFSDLVVVKCIHGIDHGLCGDELCPRCISIAFEPGE